MPFWPFKKSENKYSVPVDIDSFSDGQIQSKIWLCEELETVVETHPKVFSDPLKISVLAGWSGILPFLLFARGRLNIHRIDLFDVSFIATSTSKIINDSWKYQKRFFSHTMDINKINFNIVDSNIWINTSVEHFDDDSWWKTIPSGSVVILQGNNMNHEEHVRKFHSPEDLKDMFAPWSEVYYLGGLDFDYEALAFTRYMIIAKKA